MLASRRPRLRTDSRALEVVLVSTSILLWVPYIVAAVYVAYCNAFFLEATTTFAHAAAAVASSSSSASVTSAMSGGSSGGGLFAAVARSPPATAAASLLHRTRLVHRYSQFYYYVFPDGFDVIAFLPAAAYVLGVSALAVASTYVFAVHVTNGGEFLMVVAWVLGVLSERWWLTSSQHQQQYTHAGVADGRALYDGASALPRPPRWLWLVVSMITGLFSGVLCKVKDIVEGKQDRNRHLFRWLDRHRDRGRVAAVALVPERALAASSADKTRGSNSSMSGSGSAQDERSLSHARTTRRLVRRARPSRIIGLGERLYMVVPFCTGQWFHFITRHGWRGIVLENGIIVLTLGMIGYTMVSYQLLKRQVLSVAGRSTALPHAPPSYLHTRPSSSSSLRHRHDYDEDNSRSSRRSRAATPRRSPRTHDDQAAVALVDDKGGDRDEHAVAQTDATHDAASTTAAAAVENDVAAAAAVGEKPTTVVDVVATHDDTAVSDDDDDDDDNVSDVDEEAVVVSASVIEHEDVVIDLIDLISKLFTTSFGVVVLVVLGLDVFLTSLAIPFIQALFSLNALVSSAGIIVELIVYDVV